MKTQVFILVCFLALLLALPAAAQVWEEWVARYNGPANSFDGANSLATDLEGNVFVAGESAGDTTGPDYVLIKYSSSGEQLWVARYNGPGNGADNPKAIAVDETGCVYITGESYGGSTGYDFATLKYDSEGQLIWIARYDGSVHGPDQAIDLALDCNGNVYVCGLTEELAMTDYGVVKYDANGNELWASTFNGSGNGWDDVYAIAVDANCGVIVTGMAHINFLGADIVTVKYDSSGVQQWVGTYDGGSRDNDCGEDIVIDSNGNIYVAGWAQSIEDNSDAVILKYSSDGMMQWAFVYPGMDQNDAAFYAVNLDQQGNIVATGATFGPDDLDILTTKCASSGDRIWLLRYDCGDEDLSEDIEVDLSGNIYVAGTSDSDSSTGTNKDYITLKFDTAGNLLWEIRYDGSQSGSEHCYALALDSNSGVFVTGSSNGDFVTIKYGQVNGIAAPSPQIMPTGFWLFPAHPNPFNAATVIRFQLPVASYVKMEVMDIAGRVVGASAAADCAPLLPGLHEFPFDASGLPSGIYLCRIEAGDWSAAQKLVLLK